MTGLLLLFLAMRPIAVVDGDDVAQNGRQGGPPATFRTEVPAHALTVIQTQPSASSTGLSVMATKDMTVRVTSNGVVDKTSLQLVAFEPQTVRISKLNPSKSNDFAVRYDGGEVRGQLKTPASAGKPTTFCIQADSHLDQNTSTATYLKSLAGMRADRPDFWMDLGDTFMTGKRNPFDSAIDQYRAQRYYFSQVDAPPFLVLGNHDGEQGWIERGQSGMTAWARSQRTKSFPPLDARTFGSGNVESANYFAFVWGDAQIIALDPYSFTKVKPGRNGDGWNWTIGDAQYQWLVRTLKASRSKYRFVFIHHLVGGADKDARGGAEASKRFEWGGENADASQGFAARRTGWEAPIHEILKRYKVDVVFHGHDHFFAKQDRDGIVYQLVPQPGHSGGQTQRSAPEYGYLSGTILSGSGYMRVRCGEDKAVVEFVRVQSSGTPEVAFKFDIAP